VSEVINVRVLHSKIGRFRARLAAVALLALPGIVAAGYAGTSASAAQMGVAGASHTTSAVAVKTRKISGLGVVLVNAKGRTLYAFMRDKHHRVTCTGSCATFWPPLKAKGTSKPKAGGAAKSKFLGSDKDPAGGRVVTYNKWPLYTYVGDQAAGQATGQGLNASGGKWYVISAKGKIVKG
jgi:predicted lipoprotein with Yx(FWY)xxD motif